MSLPGSKILSCILTMTMLMACEQSKKTQAPENIQNKVDELRREASITGLQLAYFDSEYDYRIIAGFSNNADSTKVNENTPFQAASLSKQVTAILTFKMAEEGLVDLNQPIAEVYQSPRLKDDPFYFKVTLSHLLTHTSGLPNWSDDLRLDFVPGSNWQYSGEGYNMIAKVLESQTGKTLEELSQEKVFGPLGMSLTSFDQSTSENLVAGHSESEVPTKKRISKVNAAASLITTASDYAKLVKAAFFGDFLNAESKALLTNKGAQIVSWDGEATKLGWTHGIGFEETKEGQILWQWGDNNYHRGLLIIDHTKQKVLIYLTNSQNGLSIAAPLVQTFFNTKYELINWIDYTAYNEPEHQLTVDLKKGFYWENKERAFEIYDKNIEAVTDDIFNNVVWSFFYTKDLKPAQNIIEKHLDANPESAAGWARNGEALTFSHEYQEAWKAYQKAMELDPGLSKEILPPIISR